MSLALRSWFCLIAALAVLAPPLLARADMPGGGGDDCEMQDGCVTCAEPEAEEGNPEYEACAAEAMADDLHVSCSDYDGSYLVEYWCPAGVDANAGCSAAAGPATQGAAFLVSCVAALGLSLMRRARRK